MLFVKPVNRSCVAEITHEQKKTNIYLSLFASIIKCCSAGRWYSWATNHQILLTSNRVFFVFHTICQHVFFKLTCFVHVPPLPSFVSIKHVSAPPSSRSQVKGLVSQTVFPVHLTWRRMEEGHQERVSLWNHNFVMYIYTYIYVASICLSNISWLWILGKSLIYI